MIKRTLLALVLAASFGGAIIACNTPASSTTPTVALPSTPAASDTLPSAAPSTEPSAS